MKRGRWDSESEGEEATRKKAEKKAKEKEKRSKAAQANSLPATAAATTATTTATTSVKEDDKALIADKPSTDAPSFRTGRVAPASRRCRSVDCYERLNFIDEGTYGMVFRARCKETNEIYAIKQVKLGQHVGKLGFPIVALREINVLLALRHPNIIPVREMVVGSGSDKIFMVMEFCENDVKTVMKQNQQSFSTAEIKRLMLQLLSAVDFMHTQGYLHRDLKTSNLLYSNQGRLYVCDFGLARQYETPAQPYTPEVVTLWYRCPELLLGSKVYSTPLDMWSVGCIFAELVTGDPIFPGEGEMDQMTRIFKVIGAPSNERWPGFADLPHSGKLTWRLPPQGKLRELFPKTAFAGGIVLSDLGINLLSKLLEMDPAKRISASESMEHPWLTAEVPFPTQPDLMPTFTCRHNT